MTPIERSNQDPKSLRKAVNAKCYHCVGEHYDPNPVGRIRECEVESCPLWKVRPYQNGSESL